MVSADKFFFTEQQRTVQNPITHHGKCITRYGEPQCTNPLTGIAKVQPKSPRGSQEMPESLRGCFAI